MKQNNYITATYENYGWLFNDIIIIIIVIEVLILLLLITIDSLPKNI